MSRQKGNPNSIPTNANRSGSTDEIPSRHWADQAADELVKLHPDKATIVSASGISPSGVVHIGNFREAITVDFVVRALRERGRKVRFIYSWDDYDALRKVPANLPQPEMLNQNLRRPISEVPDPFGTAPSYAAHFEKRFENEISQLGILPEYIYQNEAYRSCRYADGIREALRNQSTIVEILNRSRTEPLPADWTCVSIFCKKCGKDVTKLEAFVEPNILKYACKICKQSFELNFDTEGGAKLLWRVDWPMRWAREGVDFEPGGKDHSSQGGSYDTGVEIIKAVWKKEAPFYVQYDFVLAKGLGSKLSSSSGNLITLSEALEVYEPAVIRWIFASRKPNLDFTIAFDLDVMRTYDDFDRTERFAYGVEEGEEKKTSYEKRIYEFSTIAPRPPGYAKLPMQFGFRHLCNILQIYQGDLAQTKAFFADLISTELDAKRFESRASRAWKWITTFAPEEFKFQLRKLDTPIEKSAYPNAVAGVAELLRSPETKALSEDDLASRIFEIMKGEGLEAGVFFAEIYRILIGKKNGPKLASFIIAIGPERVAQFLSSSL